MCAACFAKGENAMDTSEPCVLQTLCDALKMSQVTEADFSSCGIGPDALSHLSEWVRDATAAVARLSLSGNTITVTSQDRSGNWTCDADLSGLNK